MDQETPQADRQRGGDRGSGSGGDDTTPPRPPQKRRASTDPASEASDRDSQEAKGTTPRAEGGGSGVGAAGGAAGEAEADDGAAAAAGAARDLPPSVFEEGRLFLLYKPKVQVEEVKSMADVQRFFMVMEPTSPPGHCARLVVIPKKRLPSQDPKAKGKERFYGFVQATVPLEGKVGEASEGVGAAADGTTGEGSSKPQGNTGGEARGSNTGAAAAPAGEVDASVDTEKGNQEVNAGGGGGDRPTAATGPVRSGASALILGLQGGDYDTKTRGRRHQGPARLLAEATYVIGCGGSRNAPHLAYRLEVPLEPGPAQQLFCVGTAGDLILSIKNPENRPPGAPTAGPAPAQYNERQAKRLKGRAWVGAEDTSMLDVEGAELLLVGTGADDPAGHLGEAGHELDDLTHSEMEGSASEEEDGSEGSGEKDPQLQAVSKLRAIVGASSGAAAGDKEGGAEQTPIPIEPAVTGKLV